MAATGDNQTICSSHELGVNCQQTANGCQEHAKFDGISIQVQKGEIFSDNRKSESLWNTSGVMPSRFLKQWAATTFVQYPVVDACHMSHVDIVRDRFTRCLFADILTRSPSSG